MGWSRVFVSRHTIIISRNSRPPNWISGTVSDFLVYQEHCRERVRYYTPPLHRLITAVENQNGIMMDYVEVEEKLGRSLHHRVSGLHFADVRVLGMAVSMAASSRPKLRHSFHVASRGKINPVSSAPRDWSAERSKRIKRCPSLAWVTHVNGFTRGLFIFREFILPSHARMERLKFHFESRQGGRYWSLIGVICIEKGSNSIFQKFSKVWRKNYK